jgi:archaellum component FlaC
MTTDSERLDKIENSLEKLVTEIDHLSKDVETLRQEMIKTNDKVEIDQKASQQVVNLAFSLILTATITIVAQVIINH